MFLTVTPDPVLDRIFFIEEWLPGLPMHADKTITSVGGKGLDASVVLSHLGVETNGLCFLAGEIGERLLERVKAYGIHPLPIWVSGETRSAQIIVERARARHSHVFSGGISVNQVQLDQFLTLYQQHLSTAHWVLTGGVFPDSIPPDFFRIISSFAHQAGVPVLIDSHSHFIQNALPANLEIIKMNRKEFEWTFDQPVTSLNELVQAGGVIYSRYRPEALVITCGAEGLIAFTGQGVYQARPPAIEVVNAAGAGDAVTAALAWRRSLGDSWLETLRWAVAASAAVVLTEGTADLHRSDVNNLLPRITIERIGEVK